MSQLSDYKKAGNMYRDPRESHLLHTRNIDYSPEVQRLLKNLIEEGKLTISQRKEINESLKRGDPLPLPPKPSKVQRNDSNFSVAKLIHFPRRRKKEQIKQSGAYDLDDHFVYSTPMNYEKEKQRLQDLIAFGKVVRTNGRERRCFSASARNSKEKTQEDKNADPVQCILNEIDERENFLEEMKRMGHANEYKDIVNQEIAAKMRTLGLVGPDTRDLLRSEYKQQQDMKAAFNSLLA